jgi:hypothetical protein
MNLPTDFETIEALDLDPIKVKLMHVESGEGWSLEKANAVEREYRRFLYLMKTYPHEQAAPLMDVDTFWHYHILDTQKYAVDCQAVFGYFLHHFPYIGLRGEDDLAAHERLGKRMAEIYEQTFGESYIRPKTLVHEGETAYSAASATAYSAVAGKTAYSAASAKTAYSAVAATAYSAVASKTAYSAASAKIAYSAAAGKTAYSAVAAAAYSAASGKVAYSAMSADNQDPLFTVRPTLKDAVKEAPTQEA